MQTAERLRRVFSKKKPPGRLLLAALMLMSGCESMSPTDKGVLGGGALGGLAGGLIGAASHHTALGAVAGTVIGGAAGGLAGNAVEQSEQRQAMRQAAANAPPPLSLPEIARLSQTSSDSVIINQIRASGSVYRLRTEDIIWLQQSGVREPVITEMQATAMRVPRPMAYGPPPVQPVYVVEPVYAPPPVVGVGFGWRSGWR